jgi:phage tail sheath protein FI
VVESFENLSILAPDPSGRYVADVVNHGSAYITISVTTGATQPPADITALLGSSGGTPGTPGAVLRPSTTAAGPAGAFENAALAAETQLDQLDQFSLLCVPGMIVTDTLSKLEAYCEKRRAFLIADSDFNVTDPTKLPPPGISGTNAAYYYPWLQAADPLSATGALRRYPPCGFVAGMYARTDASRGVWKAPAGTETALVGVSALDVPLTDDQNGLLNQVAVNCIRNFPVYGTVIWGARTVQGADQAASQWKYVPVRRLAMYLEESLYRGLKWAVFEPNDAPLWGQIRLNVGAFMQTLFRQGAFQGTTPQQAYFVKCDSETTTAADQNNGIVNILVGFAPLKPAEFVVLQLQQMAGQAAA